jgi:hypothetical protein
VVIGELAALEREQLGEQVVDLGIIGPAQRRRGDRIRPGWSASSVRKISTTRSGVWFGIMMPPAPTRIREVTAATCAISTSGAEVAMLAMLWCSATQ